VLKLKIESSIHAVISFFLQQKDGGIKRACFSCGLAFSEGGCDENGKTFYYNAHAKTLRDIVQYRAVLEFNLKEKVSAVMELLHACGRRGWRVRGT
jgi:hypothetical protein